MPLRDAIPDFAETFPHVREIVRAETVPEFLAVASDAMIGSVLLFIWDEMVYRNVVADPMGIARIPGDQLYDFVTGRLGEQPIRDVFSIEFFNDVDPEVSFAEVVLALCYPNDLHIVDVKFLDNRRPVYPNDQTWAHRKFRGLHVFEEFVNGLRRVAGEVGADRLSLIVAYKRLHTVFSRHGFVVSPTTGGQRGFKEAGVGYPMILALEPD